jgi:hypothetical protein
VTGRRLPAQAATTGGMAAALGAAVLIALGAALVARPPATVALDVGGTVGDFLGEGWSEADRTDLNTDVGALDPGAAGFNRFRFRAASPSAEIRLPVVAADGTARLRLKAMARVRTAVAFHVAGQPAVEVAIPRGPWAVHDVELRPGTGNPLEADLALRPLPMVRVPDEFMARPVVWVSDLEATSPGGLRFTPSAQILFGVVPLVIVALALAAGAGGGSTLGASASAAAMIVVFARLAPLPLIVVLTRLLPFALAAGVLSALALARATSVPPRVRAALSGLVVAGTLLHGSLPFVPKFDPYDVEVHVRRAQDLGRVPLDYEQILRYGSHLPTETQTFGTATAALGERTLIPYSPLPYVFFYALGRAGIDLHWGMIVLDAALAMLVVPWLWVVAARVWSASAAWTAALLYTLDLPVWHHLARAHVPATFGSALGTAALLLLVHEADRLDEGRRVALTAVALAVAVLGYSSLIVFFGLFGLVLLLLMGADARALPAAAKRGLAVALVAGGLLAGVLFYFHYLPGLLHGAGSLQEEPDPFQARTYFVFHNESRQSMRVWAAGFAIPLLAGLLAAPVALPRARPASRPVLVAWLATWPLVMLCKEPFLFPRPLRWAKEDQFVSPLLALLIGGAVAALPRPWMRWTAGAFVATVALWLQLGDFRIHATGLMP